VYDALRRVGQHSFGAGDPPASSRDVPLVEEHEAEPERAASGILLLAAGEVSLVRAREAVLALCVSPGHVRLVSKPFEFSTHIGVAVSHF
jgi:hypothetical protein